MFEIHVENPRATIEGALTATGFNNSQLAKAIGCRVEQLSKAKKAARLPAVLEKRFRDYLETNGGAPVAEPEPAPAPVPSDTINIELLQTDEEVQQRVVHIDEETVDRYAATVCIKGKGEEKSWPFPAITVFCDADGKHWLADGWHRVETAKRVHIQEVPAEIHRGTKVDAILHAVGANEEHGLPRTTEDKRKAVITLLKTPVTSDWPDRQIADQCKVSHSFAGKIRKEFEAESDETNSLDSASSQIGRPPPKLRKGRDGRTINTAGIGKSNRERAQKPKPSQPAPNPAKAAHDAIARFAGACADIRKIADNLTATELFKVAERCRDQLIWILPKLDNKDADAMIKKIAAALEDKPDEKAGRINALDYLVDHFSNNDRPMPAVHHKKLVQLAREFGVISNKQSKATAEEWEDAISMATSAGMELGE